MTRQELTVSRRSDRGGTRLQRFASVSVSFQSIGAAVEASQRISHVWILPVDRLIVGIGSGATHTGSLALMTEETEILKAMFPGKVVIGALGPKMLAVGASVGDGVLLNWLTPAWARVSRNLAVAAAGEAVNRGDRLCACGYARR